MEVRETKIKKSRGEKGGGGKMKARQKRKDGNKS